MSIIKRNDCFKYLKNNKLVVVDFMDYCTSALYGIAKYGQSRYSIMCMKKTGTAEILGKQGKKLFNIEASNY